MRLTIGDVIDHDGQVSIRLGDPGLGPPNPFAAMLTEMAANADFRGQEPTPTD